MHGKSTKFPVSGGQKPMWLTKPAKPAPHNPQKCGFFAVKRRLRANQCPTHILRAGMQVVSKKHPQPASQ